MGMVDKVKVRHAHRICAALLVFFGLGCEDSVEVDCASLEVEDECNAQAQCLYTTARDTTDCFTTCAEGDSTSCPAGTSCSDEALPAAPGETQVFRAWLCMED